MLKKGYIPVCVSLLIIVLIFSSCGVTLKSVKENPQPYLGQKIEFRGKISDILNVPFTDFSIYVFEQKETQAVVLSATPHEKNQHITLAARVVGFPQESTIDAAKQLKENLVTFLVSEDLVKKKNAEPVANALVQGIKGFSKAAGSTFVLLELP